MILQVGVKALIRNSKGEYLFLKRTKILNNGTVSWDIPGGRINSNDPILLGLQREIYEETGASVNTASAHIINTQDIFLGDKVHIVRLAYIIESPSIVVKLSDEHFQYKFLTLDHALHVVTEPELKATIEQIIATLQGSTGDSA